MAVNLAMIATEARNSWTLQRKVRMASYWLARAGKTIVASDPVALNSAGGPHREFMGIAHISREEYDGGSIAALLDSRLDRLIEGFKAWFNACRDNRDDATTHERTALEFDAATDFATDSIALKLYWRGSFVDSDGKPIIVEVPAHIQGDRPEGATATFVIGSEVGEHATQYLTRGGA